MKIGDEEILKKRYVNNLHSIWLLTKENYQEGGLDHQLDKLTSSVYAGQSLSLAAFVLAHEPRDRDSSGRTRDYAWVQ